jgi:hypothetical protein
VESDFGEPNAEEESAGETCLYYQEDGFFSDREFAFCFRGGFRVRKFDYKGFD